MPMNPPSISDDLLRSLIDHIARTSAQLDRFLSDNFNDVYRQLPGGMLRDDRITTLFNLRPGAEKILAGLERSFPRSYAEAASAAEFASLFAALHGAPAAAPAVAAPGAAAASSPASAPASAPVAPPPPVAPAPARVPRSAPAGSLPRHLLEARARGEVIPFAGAGVSMAVRHRKRSDGDGRPAALFPSWPQLLQRAADALRANAKPAEADVISGMLRMSPAKLLEAAQIAQASLGALYFPFLKEQFDPEFGDVQEDSLALPRLLWRVGSRLLVTTNYDRVLRWACPDLLGRNLAEISLRNRVEPRELLSTVGRPAVWHLHGGIDDLENIVLTPNGYDLLYPREGQTDVRYQAALHALRTLLLTRTFLFVGFSFTDERFGDQLRWIAETFGGASGPHYVLIREREAESARERLRRQPGIEIITFEDHGEPLLRLLGALT